MLQLWSKLQGLWSLLEYNAFDLLGAGPRKKMHGVLCGSHFSVLYPREKMYKTTEMLFCLTDWELLVHAGLSWC